MEDFLHCCVDRLCRILQISKKRTAQKMKFSINDFFSKCDQICSFLRIWSHLLRKSFMENFTFCAVAFSHTVLFTASDDFRILYLAIPSFLLHLQIELHARNAYDKCYSRICVYLLCDAGKR